MSVMLYRKPVGSEPVTTVKTWTGSEDTYKEHDVICAFLCCDPVEIPYYVENEGYVVNAANLIEKENPLTVENLRELAKSKGIKLKSKTADEMKVELTKALEVANNGDN